MKVFVKSRHFKILWPLQDIRYYGSLSSRTTTAKPNQIINSLMNHLQLTLQRFLALHEWSFSWNSSHSALFVPHLQPLPLVTTQSRNLTFLVPKDQPLTHLRSPCFNCSLRHAEFQPTFWKMQFVISFCLYPSPLTFNHRPVFMNTGTYNMPLVLMKRLVFLILYNGKTLT